METIKVKFIHDKLSKTPKYTSLFQGMYRIGQEYGFRGVYSGLLATTIKQSSN